MTMLLPMSAGVAILRIVTASNHPAAEASTEVNPGITSVHAQLTNVANGLCDSIEILEMVACSLSHLSSLDIEASVAFATLGAMHPHLCR